MIWFYTKSISSRLIYIADILMGKDQYILSTDQSVLHSEQLCINYSNKAGGSKSLQIIPQGILSETNIAQQKIEIKEWNHLPVFFETKGAIPFDVFAASFYLITRYEEYLPHEKDNYGRYDFTNSIAYKYHFLDQPLIEQWQQVLHGALHDIDETYIYKKAESKIIVSYDIDIAFKYKSKGFFRNCGGWLKDIMQMNAKQIVERMAVLSGAKKDPFDLFDHLLYTHKKRQIPAIFFFLMAANQKGHDKNISPSKKELQQLIKKLANTCHVGLHPSAKSNDGKNILLQEKSTLEAIAGKPVLLSRQHYILMILPYIYQALIATGISTDFSMGYGGINGFRASYSRPFTWFDLSTNTATPLMIHPFCWMDANCIFNEKKTPAAAQQQLGNYIQLLKQTGGICTVIFHNHFLTSDTDNMDWHALWEWLLAID